MPNLRLISLNCLETEDNWGGDHAYLKVNGILVWGPDRINDNQSRDLAAVGNLPFEGSASIELWDKDDGDPDDHLGTNVAWASKAGAGTQEAYFNQDDANYRLYYQVV